MKRRSIGHVVLCIAMASLGPRLARGVDYRWNAPDGSSEDFSNGYFWTPIGVPNDPSDRAIFDLPGSREVVFDIDLGAAVTNRSFEARAGSWDFLFHNGGLSYILQPTSTSQPAATIGTTAGVTEVIARSLSNASSFQSQGTLTLGLFAGNIGRLELHNMRWSSPSSATIGNGGAGVLILDAGPVGWTMTNSSAVLGNLAGALGTVTLKRESSWDLSSTLQIGNQGTGLLILDGPVHVRNVGHAMLGVSAGSSGTVILQHPDSLWENRANLYVGGGTTAAGGTGQLTIDAGTVLLSGNLNVWDAGEVEINANPPTGETGAGSLDVDGVLTVGADGGLYLSGGSLHVASAPNFRPAPGTFHWTAGELDFKSGGFTIGPGSSPQAPLGPVLTLDAKKSLTVAGDFAVGSIGDGQLSINGGRVNSVNGLVGGRRTSTVAMSGASATWTTSTLSVGGEGLLDATQLILSAGAQLNTTTAEVAKVPQTALQPALAAAVRLEGDLTQWHATDAVSLGWSSTGNYDRGGIGTLAIINGGTMTVDGPLSIGRNFTVSLDGGKLTTQSSVNVLGRVVARGAAESTWNLFAGVFPVDLTPRSITVDGGTIDLGAQGLLDTGLVPVAIQIQDKGSLVGRVKGGSGTQLVLSGADSSWTTPGEVTVGGASSGVGRLASLSLNGGTLNATAVNLLDGSDFTGSGEIHARFSTPGNVVANGNLTLGDATSFNGVVIGGNLTVGPHSVTINKRGFFNVGLFTDISGGTLVAPGGVSLPAGNALTAFGAVNGRVFAQGGSTIEATGDFTLGDLDSIAGFHTDGDLIVNQHTVTLRDANAAVLGSLTMLGAGNRPGVLRGVSGLLIDFGNNVIGYGTLQSPDRITEPTINNGLIAGTSAAQPITLTGYVKGVGTFDHVVFAGTFAPGLSPAAVQLGNAVYDDNSTLVLELGGTSPGTQYDQLNHSGTATFGGTLDVDILGGFMPALGQQFVLATYGDHVGEFDALSLPTLIDGLNWSLNYGPTSLVLSVTNSTPLPGDIDLDGDVDRVDASLFAQHFGRTAGSVWSTGDFDADGMTTLADLTMLQFHVGETSLRPVAELVDVPAIGVPEPHSIALLAAMASLVVWRPRRRSK